ncbi:MAG TPA: hypothetical protein VMU81_10230 [Acetobacteraceae bacterium]|nr:hypothetical protein [Acetobacteraceae bacterium]
MGTVQGVTVVCDFIRSDKDGRPGEGDRSAVWLFDAIKRQVAKACSLPMHLLTARGCRELESWVAAKRSPADADAFWAANYANLAIAPALETIFLRPLSGQFVIGHEMPPYLLYILAACEIPHLDVRIHPVRFLDDLLFAVKASDPETQESLHKLSISEEVVLATAGLVQAQSRYTADSRLPPETLLVIGQRTMDSSQIIDGRFFDALQHLPQIQAIFANYRGILLKPHPYGGQHSLLLAAAAAPNALAVTEDNVYRLLAQPEISGVLSVNSSSVYEARYFDKQIHTLAPMPAHPVWREDVVQPGSYLSVDDFLFSVDFWRLALRGRATVSSLTGVRLPPKPNRLRIAHDSFWNFNELDTDRIPRRPMTGTR